MTAGLGLTLAGCTQSAELLPLRPRPHWPGQVRPPQYDARTAMAPIPAQTPLPQRPSPPSYPAPAPKPMAMPRTISRSSWARMSIVPDRINPMGAIKRITLHHEGWTPVRFTDVGHTVERLQKIQKFHIKERGWGDIGYHFIIDRAGRVWAGRSLAYQGAHVAGYNEHNVGLMLLGNFDLQQPSRIQLASAQTTIINLMTQFKVPTHQVYTHQELKATQCPGKNLQPRLVAMRQSGSLG